MEKLNRTKNQHYISQVEQKLNAINPLDKRQQRRIFSFTVVDRDNAKIALNLSAGNKIENSLSMNDLFTYAINDDGLRHNLEEAFCRYEAKLETTTNTLINKISLKEKHITDEIIQLLTYKFLNIMRNPFCIKKTLNIFDHYKNHYPTDGELKQEFELISQLKQDDMHVFLSNHLNKLNVSIDEYKDWLRLLFLSLMPAPSNQGNILEGIVESILTDSTSVKHFRIDHYVDEHFDKCVLLSDRSWLICSEDNAPMLILKFNLSSNLMLTFGIVNLETQLRILTNGMITEEQMEYQKNQLKNIQCNYETNDLEALSEYNRAVIYQCYEKVFSSSLNIQGARII